MKKKINIELVKKALTEILKFAKDKQKVSRKKNKEESDRIWGYQFTDHSVTIFKKPKNKKP